MSEQPDLKWLNREPTPEEVEWARRMEAAWQDCLQAFALPPEMLGELLAEMNTNRAYGWHLPDAPTDVARQTPTGAESDR